MIIGIGHDIVEIGRVKRLLEGGAGESFLHRVLTPGELSRAAEAGSRRAEFVAGRFAAKEAVSKAFGCGIGAKLGFHDMETLPDAYGKPVCWLSAEAWRRLGFEPDEAVVHLSITHERELASAFAVAERKGGGVGLSQ